ncbi:MAG: hypothetical protein M3Q49_19445 [Actinomycetota bacterium]|nr:hypothetical protein [Actinomycetota bacterium]
MDFIVSIASNPTAQGVILGGAITLLASWGFYRKASRDLEDKIKRLEESIRVLGIYLERGDVTGGKMETHPDGRHKPFTQTIQAGYTPSEPKVFPPTVTREDPPEDPEVTDEDQDPKT